MALAPSLRWNVSLGMDHSSLTAKVFMNGRSQAIRLPKEFRVGTDEVHLKRTPEGFLAARSDLGRVHEFDPHLPVAWYQSLRLPDDLATACRVICDIP